VEVVVPAAPEVVERPELARVNAVAERRMHHAETERNGHRRRERGRNRMRADVLVLLVAVVVGRRRRRQRTSEQPHDDAERHRDDEAVARVRRRLEHVPEHDEQGELERGEPCKDDQEGVANARRPRVTRPSADVQRHHPDHRGERGDERQRPEELEHRPAADEVRDLRVRHERDRKDGDHDDVDAQETQRAEARRPIRIVARPETDEERHVHECEDPENRLGEARGPEQRLEPVLPGDDDAGGDVLDDVGDERGDHEHSAAARHRPVRSNRDFEARDQREQCERERDREDRVDDRVEREDRLVRRGRARQLLVRAGVVAPDVDDAPSLAGRPPEQRREIAGAERGASRAMHPLEQAVELPDRVEGEQRDQAEEHGRTTRRWLVHRSRQRDGFACWDTGVPTLTRPEAPSSAR
jgi:hypothetical protein